jgi:hypothetical protein
VKGTIKQSTTVRNNGAPLLELLSYPFSKNMKFVNCVDLASCLLHKSRREIWKNEAGLYGQTIDRKTRRWQTNAHLWHIYVLLHTHAQTNQVRRDYCISMYVCESVHNPRRESWCKAGWIWLLQLLLVIRERSQAISGVCGSAVIAHFLDSVAIIFCQTLPIRRLYSSYLE